ncbi:MAG: hypothetical protein GPJ54_04440 [Candidatus Heimdallarchaeota archaeon]|nr:hypothetical protein [Candidatus Heimdallarchaeota archaeon]
MSRVINHLLKDIASLTRYHPDTSSRLCFLLGAREAIHLMLAVRDAAEDLFLILHVPEKEKGIDQVKKKVSKDFNKQGYEFVEREELGNVFAVNIRDRKKIIPDPNSTEQLVNKYKIEEIKHRGLPQVILRRTASINASMGADIVSGDISSIPPLQRGDEAVLMDMYYNIVGHGIADMSSEEIKRSPGRIAIKTLEGRYDVPKFHDNKYYRNGLYSIITLPRLLGINLLKFTKERALILVICQDNGEVAVELLNRASEGSKIFMITRNENHRKAISSTLERLQIKEERIELLKVGLDRYTKSRPREKFTHFYLEMPSTETGKRPNPYFDQEEKVIISNARAQFSALRGISLVGINKAQIAYVTHSIDPSENQEVIIQAFRQGNFKPVDIDENIVKEYPIDLNALPEIPTVTQSSSIDLDKFDQEKVYSNSWLKIDPRVHKSDAGFVSQLSLELR